MGASSNRVAVITGAARGQGRSHAIALAAMGMDIIAIDRCADIDSIPYPLATPDELDETANLIRAAGGRITTVIADVRDLAALQSGIDSGVAEFGDIDVVIANAGVVGMGLTDPLDGAVFDDIVGTNLRGVWHTIAATAPSMIRKGGGSMVLISSMQGLVGRGGDGSAAIFAYAASKHGVVGLMRSAANAYAQQNIRVNSVHPTGVATPMIFNEHMARVFEADPNASAMSGNLLPVPFVEPVDVTNAVLYLISDSARYVTGVTLPVDAGYGVM
ncbi:SDR family mycofactocin-dependent oxidoreductase [Mycolicibacterium sp. BK556]|uniref:mycofactocin-coupled SDR family oxidoreductase n=1 Tax=Mycobacteriaceae TaxID=1762 RepID=UPI001060D604|nr:MULTISPECIES: mycofactocin-coupled SDR family oxidoreductase [Mycobacteriaceae]MBB3602661.1 SDR family mycofactocin-dependent oxidoreductase [Mycolicibacterium sp. BK556]MBB3632413.1 SDR family mycofactocin-dependent oxidoreductase [Mycolicibacterium sp. BK607]MBB3750446.1 SDR family mycofactocin-dependent oxidoreductase [Mycolicibacterium sp. BK634]TDO18298.1 SDR family mycofactocin-dependent oxidoreductase [Mycobacterium sp. BK086]